ncbi:uncharacterized protein CANTADRAFT_48489 [Suhomyces tanzawaensis NRRL Y-17324]|uniref:Uncharacterized protein n=1 Tax=Suhomyces tanzawaensis NRRL Y-17324 TaxID=984487 RepID=A0A1E4SJS5_9ASCO|nr:uncharacterized protein CANTADRAFT_48489 [Suhomyces tanzawaensis NRRL Y-17324]ODV79765.1 hypothetical protein CANTADRAFT_48489 [Suhomyces tanzawaensis NRRL Y-17324]
MSDPSPICTPTLFLKVPGSPVETSLQEFNKELGESTDFDDLVDKTYALLTQHQLNIQEALAVWETRLTLHLFNNQLSYAKKEAINLNNALYLQENPNPAPLPGGNRSRGNSVGSSTPPLQPIYPLPKNKAATIEYDLLVLLLRLKSIPNMNLINELYKLNFQMRLKSDLDEDVLRMKLINLSYDIMVILSVTKNHATLLNYLHGLRLELERIESKRAASAKSDAYSTYLSNVILVQIIIESIVHKQKKTPSLELIIAAQYGELFKRINEETKRSLIYVLRHILPTITENQMVAYDKSELSLDDLIGLVAEDKISVRIICSMLGLWDLSNNYGFQLSGETEISYGPVGTSLTNQVTNNWYKYINKVYGLE